MNFTQLNPAEIKSFLIENDVEVSIDNNPPGVNWDKATQLFARGISDNFTSVELTDPVIALDRSVRFPKLINGTVSRERILAMTDEQTKQWVEAFQLPSSGPNLSIGGNYKIFLIKIAELQDKIKDQDSYTITFGEQIKNRKSMQTRGKIAAAGKGINLEELKSIADVYDERGYIVELHDLTKLISNTELLGGVPEAAILIVREGVAANLIGYDVNNLYAEQRQLRYDDKAKTRGREIKDLKYLNKVSRQLLNDLGTDKTKNLYAETNYANINDVCIDLHGNSEKRIAVGIQLGASLPLTFQWYYRNQKIGRPAQLILNNGDFYVMSEKAIGTDWKDSNIPTLRHGFGNYAC